jgi:hypothetical protein
LEVEQPGRRLVGAAFGGDDKIVGAVAGVDEAIGPNDTGAASGGPQQQGRHAEQPMPDPSIGCLVELLVDSKDVAKEAHSEAA